MPTTKIGLRTAHRRHCGSPSLRLSQSGLLLNKLLLLQRLLLLQGLGDAPARTRPQHINLSTGLQLQLLLLLLL